MNDPPARLKDGHINTLHVSLSLYHDLEIVLIVLSLLMLATAMWRKRLYLGIVTALYGLAIFNLHYWGFGVPYIMVSAWLLVRAYRLQTAICGRPPLASGRALAELRHRRGSASAQAQRALHAAHSRFAPASCAEAREQAAGRLTGAARFRVEPSQGTTRVKSAATRRLPTASGLMPSGASPFDSHSRDQERQDDEQGYRDEEHPPRGVLSCQGSRRGQKRGITGDHDGPQGRARRVEAIAGNGVVVTAAVEHKRRLAPVAGRVGTAAPEEAHA